MKTYLERRPAVEGEFLKELCTRKSGRIAGKVEKKRRAKGGQSVE